MQKNVFAQINNSGGEFAS